MLVTGRDMRCGQNAARRDGDNRVLPAIVATFEAMAALPAAMSRLLGLIFLLSLASSAPACTIPVFRFALDRWQADAFTLVLPAEKAAATADLLRPLRANGRANLTIKTAPAQAGPARPELRFPNSDTVAWSGDLGQAALDGLLDSNGRREIVRQILAGDSVIWVVCGGDPAEAERIGQRLKFLEQVASLPIQDPNDPDSRLGPGPPLKLKFSLLRLDAAAPQEALLRRMLAGPDGDADRPFAAAVFGRGRVLGAWPLKQLDDRALEEACLFLIGRCSCRVKNENPGWDLLLNVAWETSLAAVGKTAVTPPAETAALAEPEIVTATQTVTTQPAAQPVAPSKGWAIAAALLLALAAWRLLSRRTKD
jgi:hypothetical protein